VPSRVQQKDAKPASPVPRGGLQIMGLVLIVMALLAVYSNVQKARRHTIETVIITPAPAPSVPNLAVPLPGNP